MKRIVTKIKITTTETEEVGGSPIVSNDDYFVGLHQKLEEAEAEIAKLRRSLVVEVETSNELATRNGELLKRIERIEEAHRMAAKPKASS